MYVNISDIVLVGTEVDLVRSIVCVWFWTGWLSIGLSSFLAPQIWGHFMKWSRVKETISKILTLP